MLLAGQYGLVVQCVAWTVTCLQVNTAVPVLVVYKYQAPHSVPHSLPLFSTMHSLPFSSSSTSSSSSSRFSFSSAQKTVRGEDTLKMTHESFRPRKKPDGNPRPIRGQIKVRIFRHIIGAVVSTFNCFKGGEEEEEEEEDMVVTRRAPVAAGNGAYR